MCLAQILGASDEVNRSGADAQTIAQTVDDVVKCFNTQREVTVLLSKKRHCVPIVYPPNIVQLWKSLAGGVKGGCDLD